MPVEPWEFLPANMNGGSVVGQNRGEKSGLSNIKSLSLSSFINGCISSWLGERPRISLDALLLVTRLWIECRTRHSADFTDFMGKLIPPYKRPVPEKNVWRGVLDSVLYWCSMASSDPAAKRIRKDLLTYWKSMPAMRLMAVTSISRC